MSGWTLYVTIPNRRDGGEFPTTIVVEEDGESREDWECETQSYVPERTTKAIVTCNCVTGHCTCDACGKSINPWDAFCRHCGARIVNARLGVMTHGIDNGI